MRRGEMLCLLKKYESEMLKMIMLGNELRTGKKEITRSIGLGWI